MIGGIIIILMGVMLWWMLKPIDHVFKEKPKEKKKFYPFSKNGVSDDLKHD